MGKKASFLVAILVFFNLGGFSAKTSPSDSTVLAELYINTGGPQATWIHDWPYDSETKSFTTDPSTWYGITVNALGFVTSVNLRNNGLTGEFDGEADTPEGLKVFSRLKFVDVSQNSQLENFLSPKLLENLTMVKELYIGGTQISGSIPKTISNLTKLEIFDISSTSIDNIPDEIGSLTSLKTIILSSNEITSFPTILNQLTFLEELYINDNKIEQVGQPSQQAKTSGGLIVDIKNNLLDFCDIKNLTDCFPGAALQINPQNVRGGDLATDIFIDLDDTYTLETNICGDENIYLWQRKVDDNWVDIANANQSSFVINEANVEDNGEYRCRIGNAIFNTITLYSKTYNVIVNPDLAPDFEVNLNEDQSISFFINDYYDNLQFEAFQLLFSSSKFLSFEVLENPIQGQFEITNESSYAFKYTPEANYYGDDILTYRLFNTDLDIEFIGEMSFNILPVNDRPVFYLKAVGSDLIVTTLELNVKYGETVKFMAELNDDIDGAYACALEVKKNSATLAGKITYDATSKIITYFPVQNINGTDVLTLVAKETCNSPLLSEVRIVKINILEKEENDIPIANDKTVNMLQDKLIQFSLPASDTETLVENLTVNLIAEPDYAQFFRIEGGVVFYRSEFDFEGTDRVTFTVTDEKGVTSGQATILFQVSAPTYSEYPLLIDTTIIQYNGIKSIMINNMPVYNFDFSVDWFDASALDSLVSIENEYAIFFPPSALKAFFDIDNRYPYSRIRIKPKLVNFFMFNYGQDDYLNELNVFLNGKISTIGYCQLVSNDTLSVQEFQLLADSSSEEVVDAVTLPGTLLTTIDTVIVRSEAIDTLLLEAATLSGAASMEIVSAPSWGTVISFELVESPTDFISVYSVVYSANAVSSKKTDSIIYRVQNNLETSYGKLIIDLLPPKSAPQISTFLSVVMQEDKPISKELDVTDNDNLFDELYFDFEINAITEGFNLQFIDSFMWIYPPENFSGSALVTARVIDPDFQVASLSYTVNVMPQNDKPLIWVEGDTIIKYDQPLNLLISTSDVEGSPIILSVEKLPAWGNFSFLSSGLAQLTGQPQLSDEGKYQVEFYATDGQDETIKTVTIKVIGEKIDQAPEVLNPIAPINLPKEANPLQINLATVFSDPDEDALSFTVNSNSNTKWLSATIDGSMLTLAIADKDYTGLATISVNAESNELSASTSFLVYTTDQVPKLNVPITNITVWKNAKPISVSLANGFIDPDGDVLVYRVFSNSNPTIVSATVEGQNIILNFVEGAGGSSVIYVQASSYGKTVKTGFTVTIKDASPVIKNPIDDIIVSKNESLLQVDVSNLYEDADDSLVVVKVDSYSNSTLISSAEIVDNTLLVVNFNSFQLGESTIILSGNSNDKSTKHTFTITVEDRLPFVTQAFPDLSMISTDEPVTFDLDNYFDDLDGDPLTYSIKTNNNEHVIEAEIEGHILSVRFKSGSTNGGSGELEIEALAAGKSVASVMKVTISIIDGKSSLESTLIRIVPNPADKVIIIEMSPLFNQPLIEVYNLAGKNLISDNLHEIDGNSFKIDISHFVKGIYIVKITNGDSVFYQKIVKN